MIKNIFFGLFMILASSPAISGVTYWGMKADLWQKNSPFENTIYIQGIFDGLIFAKTKVNGTELSTKIDIKQYKKEIDTLYLDDKNALIPVPFLMQIITLELQGAGEGSIEMILEIYRSKFSKK